ncbi:hypothetical protein LAZ67_13000474 [Cordylochernes scorpioides]|uniref:Transposase n=1 Tax=Cordylochernes scorpioides TaxID=51811 RepID=A0ABY6L307_9ARAC|nr:hypothetical protein LAZ67_13000474 [Cordylochernes scorpioides]
MISIFWDQKKKKGMIFIGTLEINYPINKAGSNLKNTPIKFHQDNARPHMALLILAKIVGYRWTLMSHPAYSPNLAPSYFYLFGREKRYYMERLREDVYSDSVLVDSSSSLSFIISSSFCRTMSRSRALASLDFNGVRPKAIEECGNRSDIQPALTRPNGCLLAMSFSTEWLPGYHQPIFIGLQSATIPRDLYGIDLTFDSWIAAILRHSTRETAIDGNFQKRRRNTTPDLDYNHYYRNSKTENSKPQ